MSVVASILSAAVSSPTAALFSLALVVLVLGLCYLVAPVIKAGRAKRTPDHHSEMYFPDPSDEQRKLPFPRLYDDAQRYVTLVVPAYNEEERLPAMLDEMLTYLKARQSENARFTWEIIVVDDGSKDGTCNVVKRYCVKEGTDAIRLLKLHRNHGKGGAVRKGMMRGRGQYLLMVDADGATVASELGALESRLLAIEADGHGIGVGSRAHLQDEAVATRKWYRNVLMYGFHALVMFLCGGHGVRDTQCGFKLFTRRTARILFSTLHIERWAFDVELLMIAARLRIPIVEVAVKWTEIDGSKLNVLASTIQMLRDLVLIRMCYLLRLWEIEGPMEGVAGVSSVWKDKKRR